MRAEANASQEVPSFHTPSNHGVFPPGIPQGVEGNSKPPITGGNPQNEPTGKPSGKKEPTGESVSESLRSLELPKLSESASALAFGDWFSCGRTLNG